MLTPEAVPHVSQDTLWDGLPRSNRYKQLKLVGRKSADDDGGDESAATERRLTVALPADRRQADVLMLGSYHLVLQWYLDECESLIGVVARSTRDELDEGPLTIRASYVYADDDAPFEDLLHDVEREWLTRPRRVLNSSGDEAWDGPGAPVFLYVDDDRAAACVERGALLVSADTWPRAIVGTTSAASATAITLRALPSVSQALSVDALLRRIDVVVSASVRGEAVRVGELKALLGEPGDVPFRQLQEMQRRVIALWAAVLGIPPDALDESSNYYEVGGTSLNAFKLLNRVRAQFERDISIWEVIENSTVQDFARLLLRI